MKFVRKTLAGAVRRRVLSRLFIDPGDYRRTIILAGTGRSGTTWIQDVITGVTDCRVMFEPFHSKKTALLRRWNYRQYLRPDAVEAAFLSDAARILSGEARSAWIDQFNRAHFAEKRLVKDIRANLILGWIRKNFPEIPIVLLLRHPCAVAGSKLALNWDTHLNDFLIQAKLLEDHLGPIEAQIRAATDPFEKHIFLWCIENYVPLRQFSAGQIHVAFYEHFCADPEREVRSLLAYLGYPYRPEILHTIKRPSAMSRAGSAIVAGSPVLDSWRQQVDPGRVERAVEILSLFGLDRIYGADPMPLVDGNEALAAISAMPSAAAERMSATAE